MKSFVLGVAMVATLAGGACFAQTPQGNRTVASGDNNQAIATTSANALTPAKGANSFTMGQAKSRIEDAGFADVNALSKDNDGVWHGKAKKNGTTTTVWLDYKGNVGQAQ